MTSTPYIIGISGKIGAGKNYLASKLAEVYHERGFKTAEVSYAIPLKDEATRIMEDFRNHPIDFDALADQYAIDEHDLITLYERVSNDMTHYPLLTGWDRTEGVRRFLQYLGTDIRRKQNYNYWVDKVQDYFPKDVDYIFITDARFPNEADKILSLNGTLIRIDVPDEVILQRSSSRDGLKYSQEALNHDSEHALDNYKKFEVIIGESFNAEELVDNFIEIKKESLADFDFKK
jgi:thymidylate kinase